MRDWKPVRPAAAEIIDTLSALEATQRERDLATVNTALARDEVRRQLAEWGVEPERVDARHAARGRRRSQRGADGGAAHGRGSGRLRRRRR
jgi:hypothetical protein